jgi:two-component system, OmpR family, phosphate regulon response regulator PhoB
MARILVVEDEAAIAELIALNLRHAGHEVQTAADGEAAQLAVRERLPDAVVLDWMLPGTSGIALSRLWRGDPRTRTLPLLMLTARAEERDLVQGLDAGADDYLTKPFSPQELLARVRALLRRGAPQAAEQALVLGELTLDPSTMRVSWAGQELKMGPTEFRLLRYLLGHPERVHSRSQLLDRVWGDHVFIEERTVDVHIKRLREALGPAAAMVETVRGAGYRLTQSSVASLAKL